MTFRSSDVGLLRARAHSQIYRARNKLPDDTNAPAVNVTTAGALVLVAFHRL